MRSADPFHVVAWAIDALDIERRRAWNEAKGRRPTRGARPPQRRSTGDAQHIAQSRYALWKNPGDLTGRQRHQLDWIAKTDPRLWRAYLLKEGLRYVFAVKGDEGKAALDRWIDWARRSRIPAFVQLQRRIVTHRARDRRRTRHRPVPGLVESTNTKIRLLTRIAFGFHGPEPLIAPSADAQPRRTRTTPPRPDTTETAREPRPGHGRGRSRETVGDLSIGRTRSAPQIELLEELAETIGLGTSDPGREVVTGG